MTNTQKLTSYLR